MLDLIALKLQAGDGGYGRVAFHREKYVPKGGPDGGGGGDGGHVILRANKGLTTLKHFAGKKVFAANNGEMGGKDKKQGARGNDLILEVPLGTVVWMVAENHASKIRSKKFELNDKPRLEYLVSRKVLKKEKYYLDKEGQRFSPLPTDEINLDEFEEQLNFFNSSSKFESINQEAKFKKYTTNYLHRKHGVQAIQFSEDGQELIICQGGFSGRGNVSFKSSANTTPLEAEYGTLGERKLVVLELRLLADVGLVGFPNAGKSTLLSKLTKAHPKIANYPFTTLEPNLGIMHLEPEKAKKNQQAGDKQTWRKNELIVADIPGLIEGASEGKGLGHTFLRHIENCEALLFVLYLDEVIVYDEKLNNKQKAEKVWQQYQSLQQELINYSQRINSNDLLQKFRILSLNKIDIYSKELVDSIINIFKQNDIDNLCLFSGITGDGLEKLKRAVRKVVEKDN